MYEETRNFSDIEAIQ